MKSSSKLIFLVQSHYGQEGEVECFHVLVCFLQKTQLDPFESRCRPLRNSILSADSFLMLTDHFLLRAPSIISCSNIPVLWSVRARFVLLFSKGSKLFSTLLDSTVHRVDAKGKFSRV